jgi:hypothetical protein
MHRVMVNRSIGQRGRRLAIGQLGQGILAPRTRRMMSDAI